ncbi:MAG: 5-bromo-4-chloroindolyl phosphate hydrolysis family protein [Ktedonobacteraceae bacterium]|nr:5-bromo-4-chloroindolyl phosphate hydrolysis family protein [Ktedonobacteraceae bacterium]
MNISRYAIPIALGAGVVVFVIAFLLLGQAHWSPLVTLIAATVLFLLTALGTWFVVDSRSARQVEFDAYALEAGQKVHETRQKIEQIRRYVAQIKAPQTAVHVRQICADAEALLIRLQEKNPNTLLSSATELSGVLDELALLLDKYVDMQNYPRYYEDAPLKLQEGQAAIAAFEEFVVNSVRLVEQGETLRYDVARKMLEAKKFTRLT